MLLRRGANPAAGLPTAADAHRTGHVATSGSEGAAVTAAATASLGGGAADGHQAGGPLPAGTAATGQPVIGGASIARGAGGTVLQGSAALQALDPAGNFDEAVTLQLRELLDWTRQQVPGDCSGRAAKRRRCADGVAAENEYTYTTVSTAVRAFYEEMEDWRRTSLLATRRKGWRPGRFDSFRLRAVERFALECGGGGLSLEGIENLWELLDTWDGTRPGMPIDGGHGDSIRDTFKSVNAMKDAIRDDVDDAVLGAGWLKCTLLVDGTHHIVYFRPVLQVVLQMLKNAKEVRLWSGETGPAAPTERRESPLDGDAFRLSEAALMEEKKDDSCFVLGLHVYSDASQLSWSGGKPYF